MNFQEEFELALKNYDDVCREQGYCGSCPFTPDEGYDCKAYAMFLAGARLREQLTELKEED